MSVPCALRQKFVFSTPFSSKIIHNIQRFPSIQVNKTVHKTYKINNNNINVRNNFFLIFSRGYAKNKGFYGREDDDDIDGSEKESSENEDFTEDIGVSADRTNTFNTILDDVLEDSVTEPIPNVFKETQYTDENNETYLNAHLFHERISTNTHDFNDDSISPEADALSAMNSISDREFAKYIFGTHPFEFQRSTIFSLSDDLLSELPSSIKPENAYHAEILQRGRSVMRMFGVDSVFLESIPNSGFGFAEIELVGLFDKYMVEKLGLQFNHYDPTGYSSEFFGHKDPILNNPTQLSSFSMWNGMKERFEMEKKASKKPYPINLENFNRDMQLNLKQKFGFDLKVNDFIQAAGAAVAPMNLSPKLDKGDNNDVKFIKEILTSTKSKEFANLINPRAVDQETFERPLTALEFFTYFIYQLQALIADTDSLIDIASTPVEEIDDDDEEEEISYDDDRFAEEMDNVTVRPEKLVPERNAESYIKNSYYDEVYYQRWEDDVFERINQENDFLDEEDDTPEFESMEDDYVENNRSIKDNPVYQRRIIRNNLQNSIDPNTVATKFAAEDLLTFKELEANIYSINTCFLCKFDLNLEPMNAPLLARFLRPGSGIFKTKKELKTCAKHQRRVKKIVARARSMGVISNKQGFEILNPFTKDTKDSDEVIPDEVPLTEEEEEELMTDRIERGIFKPYESYSRSIRPAHFGRSSAETDVETD